MDGAARDNPGVYCREVEARGVTTYWNVADLRDEGEVKRSIFNAASNVYRFDELGAV
jgi:hypothetical protein